MKDVIKKLFITLIIKDPCKKCIVQPCCSTICDKKHDYKYVYCDIDGNIGIMRFYAASIIVISVVLSYSLWQITTITFI